MLRAVNEIKEFRFRIDSEGRVVYFDTVDMLTPIKVADNGRFLLYDFPGILILRLSTQKPKPSLAE